MLDIAPADRTKLQRARGRAEVSFCQRGGLARLERLHQSGCAKAMLPRVSGLRDAAPEVVFLNTAGGLTGGDRLGYGVELAAGTRVVATTQTAERAYAASGAQARVRMRAQVGQGARLDWLPQETILFDGAALDRETRIELDGDAQLLLCETLVLGRAAMGETVHRLRLSDRREVCRDGRPVLVDAVRIDDGVLARRSGAALFGEARAMALVALVAPGAEDAVGPVRACLAECACVAEASGWDGRCLIRLAACDLWPLRQTLIRVLTQLRGTLPPRVWQI
nr:urease accessory protein UreD [Tropicimonas marinistellae]